MLFPIITYFRNNEEYVVYGYASLCTPLLFFIFQQDLSQKRFNSLSSSNSINGKNNTDTELGERRTKKPLPHNCNNDNM